MKTITIAILLTFIAASTFAGTYVQGHVRSDGSYVPGHYRSAPDSSHNNNYSTQGNINPYTGQQGTNSRTWNDRSPSHNQNKYGNSFEMPKNQGTTLMDIYNK